MTITVSCKNKAAENPFQGIKEELPESFLEFYDRFHKDSLFQLQHIVFPLEGRRPDSTNILQWNKDEWVIHRPFDNMGVFKREIFSLKDIVIEKIKDQSGQYSMERRWNKFGNDWYLIYYEDMGVVR
jgi:hypothetical protein